MGIGAIAGLIAGLIVGAFTGSVPLDDVSLLPAGSSPAVHALLHFVTSIGLGAVIGYAIPCRPRGHAALTASGTLAALLWWVIGPLTAVPLLSGESLSWSAEIAVDRFPNLVAALFYGSLTGLLITAISAVLGRQVPLVEPAGALSETLAGGGAIDSDAEGRTKVVILGGGFGGVATAKRLEEQQPHRHGIDVTLVSKSNSLLFTPTQTAEAGAALVNLNR